MNDCPIGQRAVSILRPRGAGAYFPGYRYCVYAYTLSTYGSRFTDTALAPSVLQDVLRKRMRFAWVSGRGCATASQTMSDYITRSTRPSRFFTCNVEKHGMAWVRGYYHTP